MGRANGERNPDHKCGNNNSVNLQVMLPNNVQTLLGPDLHKNLMENPKLSISFS